MVYPLNLKVGAVWREIFMHGSELAGKVVTQSLTMILSYPCDVAVANGSTVRRVKWYMNWVQNGESQFGFYLNLMLNYQNFTLYEKIGKKKPIVIELFYQE